jgi:hypothetical protein
MTVKSLLTQIEEARKKGSIDDDDEVLISIPGVEGTEARLAAVSFNYDKTSPQNKNALMTFGRKK